MKIERIEVRRYELALDPPFRAAWDPVPRDRLRETVVLVHADDGAFGTASGAPLPDADLLSRLLVGIDPRRTEVVRSICETVDFHGGRPWAVEVAVWDLVGRSLGEPLWRLLGGRSDSLLAYASTGERLVAEERVARVKTWRRRRDPGDQAPVRHEDWREDVEVVERSGTRSAQIIELLVDANHGWRMPGDVRTPWDVATATRAHGRSSVPTSTGWRSRSRRPTSTATRCSADERRCVWPRARWCERSTRRGT